MLSSAKVPYYDTIPLQTQGDIMEIIGQTGRWQLRMFVQVFFILTLVAIHALSLAFLAPNLDHWCRASPRKDNYTDEEGRMAIKIKSTFDRNCFRYEQIIVNEELNISIDVRKTACHSWEYNESFYTSTLTSEWDLVCNREWMLSLMKCIFIIGFLAGVVVFGHLSDRYGRRPIIVCTSIITTIFTTSCAFSPSITLFLIIRFLVGLGLGGFYTTSFKLLMEMVVPEMRSLYGIGIQFGWTLGFMCLPGLVWFVKDYFWLQIALAVPSAIHMLFSWTFPESPRWLLSKGKMKEAKDILIQAVETNRLTDIEIHVTLEKMMADLSWEEEGKKRKRGVLNLLRTPGVRRLTVFFFLIWFIVSFIYFGLSFNTNELKGNPLVNFMLSGTMELPAYCLSIYTIRSVGRRQPLAVTLIVRGIICLLLYLIPIDIPETIMAAAIIGKFFITVSFGILLAYTEEVFSSVARRTGIGSTTLCEGFGSMVAPFTRELGYATHPAIPQFIFGVLSVACGALVIFLPDTDNIIIPESLEVPVYTPRDKEEKKDNLKNIALENLGD